MPTFVPRLLGAIALGISAYVHVHLAPSYPYPGTITGTQLFYAQGIVAAAAAVALLVSGNRYVWLAAVAIGVASFAAVMLYRYVDVGAIGPLPDMSDATWEPKPDKPLSAIAEASVVVWWAMSLAVSRRTRRQPVSAAPHPAGS